MLVKSRRRDPQSIDYGCYMLVDLHTNGVVAGASSSGLADFDLDDVERFLTR